MLPVLLYLGGVHSTPRGPLDLLKGIEGGVERRVDLSEHAADTVI